MKKNKKEAFRPVTKNQLLLSVSRRIPYEGGFEESLKSVVPERILHLQASRTAHLVVEFVAFGLVTLIAVTSVIISINWVAILIGCMFAVIGCFSRRAQKALKEKINWNPHAEKLASEWKPIRRMLLKLKFPNKKGEMRSFFEDWLSMVQASQVRVNKSVPDWKGYGAELGGTGQNLAVKRLEELPACVARQMVSENGTRAKQMKGDFTKIFNLLNIKWTPTEEYPSSLQIGSLRSRPTIPLSASTKKETIRVILRAPEVPLKNED